MVQFYGTVEGADAYHTDMGNSAWTGDNAAKSAALLRASVYIDGRYRKQPPSGRWESMFPGSKTAARGQEREWPRIGATDYDGNPIPDDEVPVEVEYATYEAAIRELSSPSSLSPDFVAVAAIKREKVGPIDTEYAVSADGGSAESVRPVITVIDEIIAPVLVARYDLPGVMVV
ncbi:Uncharacterised protein [Pseudomonas luteola]|uniref:Putative DnaT-like domain-containing protein n=1 Tax=Pseudomonas luteola TaxID=47886 RepID=A0A2X2CPD3_PSELU|nr:DnaT-like ssDNA-binding protein [Pseudomonas luteola]SPZ07496.1 Uncharacterised protein [Pseudomonas luteola]